MAERPYTVLSWAMSRDGYLDDGSGRRLILSNAADLDRVDAVRASCDAILVGAGTVRADNPRLVVRRADRRARRTAQGLDPSPRKVTITRHPHLDPTAAFFSTGDCEKLVYCATGAVAPTRERCGAVATVVDAGTDPSMCWVSEHLADRGVRRLMVEGGLGVHTQFLAAGLADELHVVVAPLLVGDPRAPRILVDGRPPWNPERPGRLVEVRQIEDVVLLRYALSTRFEQEGTT